MTNSRLFVNNAGNKSGHFEDVTIFSNVRQTYKSQSKRNKFMGSTCKKIKDDELIEVLDFFKESTYYSSLNINKLQQNNNNLLKTNYKKQFQKMINILSNSRYVHRHMEFTKNKNDFNQYMYLKLSGNIVAQRSILSLIVQPKYQMKNNTDNILYQEEETLIDIVVSGTEIEKPILKRNQYTWKSIAKSKEIFNRLDIEVGGLYGLKTYNVGFKCNNKKNGCDFDLYVYVDYDMDGMYGNKDCVNGRAQIVAQAGDFMVDLVTPWLKSMPFVFHAMKEMKRLNINGLKGREILSTLFKDGKVLDTERFDLMLNTSQRISKEMSTLNQNARKLEMKNLKEHQDGKRKMNHLLSFPLVGSFQFSAQFSDLDNDGYLDLIISGDFGTSAIYWNNGGNGTFTQGYFHLLEDLLDNSMGATVGDWDMDGKLDVMFTSTSITLS
eukprot:g2254.t1